jgi:hypothetical protein
MLQKLHETQAPAVPIIPLTMGLFPKRVSPSPVRVGRGRHARQGHAAGAKSVQVGEKTMVGWDGIEPPTPGFSDLGHSLCKCA